MTRRNRKKSIRYKSFDIMEIDEMKTIIMTHLNINHLDNTLIIDLQGITADNTTNDDREYFTKIAPIKIKNYIDGLKRKYSNVVIISQGDKSSGDKIVYNGIGATILELFNLLENENKYDNVTLFVIDRKKSSTKVIEGLFGKEHSLDIAGGSYNSYNIKDDRWFLKLLSYYPKILSWRCSKGLGIEHRIENAIKQFLANRLSNITFVLNHTTNNKMNISKLSSHINCNKNAIQINLLQ